MKSAGQKKLGEVGILDFDHNKSRSQEQHLHLLGTLGRVDHTEVRALQETASFVNQVCENSEVD